MKDRAVFEMLSDHSKRKSCNVVEIAGVELNLS